MAPYFFNLATIGGTFNCLHEGHIDYLDIAFGIANKVHIYVTSDYLAFQTKSYTPLSYKNRVLQIKNVLDKKGILHRSDFFALNSIVQLQDSILSTSYDLAVVEPAYFPLFENLNNKRFESGKPKFCIIYKPRTVDHDGEELSSTRNHHKSSTTRKKLIIKTH